jgi:hypothetical protein
MSEPTEDLVLIIEGVPTRDGRLVPPGVTTWREPPLLIFEQSEQSEGWSSERAPVQIAAIRRQGDRIVATLTPGGRAWLGDRALCADAFDIEIELVDKSLEEWIAESTDAVLLTFSRYEIGAATACEPSSWPWLPS